ncbi:MAG: CaiB/BaiF CoA-transferase family protein [Pseudomonadota bacterium]
MGPLEGLRIVEIRGIGPGPYAGMLLADLGAEVIVVERAAKPSGVAPPAAHDINMRGKRSIALDLKTPLGVELLLKLLDTADAMFEGFRPGVAERLGFGPEVCLERNPRLVYGRVTGWGQSGSLSQAAGHDINYIALTGALAAIGPQEKPSVPLNLIGDYAGGSLFLVVGILAALVSARQSGRGQVVDAAITDGSAHLMSIFHTLSTLGMWRPRRESNLLDGAAPFYDVFETADSRFVAIGAIEPQFFQLLLDKLQLDPSLATAQHDVSVWPELRRQIEATIRTRTQQEWIDRLEGTDVCFAPVLDLNEASEHPHHRDRNTYINVGDVMQPAPAPRFSATPSTIPEAPHSEGADTRAVLESLGLSPDQIATALDSGAAFE